MKENGKTYFLEDLFGEDVSDVETFLSDIDGDGVKELHIRNGIYYILKEKKGKLTILYEGTAIYDEPVEAMSGILYYREGGAPYNEAYYFTRFEKRWNNGERTYLFNATTVTRMERLGGRSLFKGRRRAG